MTKIGDIFQRICFLNVLFKRFLPPLEQLTNNTSFNLKKLCSACVPALADSAISITSRCAKFVSGGKFKPKKCAAIDIASKKNRDFCDWHVTFKKIVYEDSEI